MLRAVLSSVAAPPRARARTPAPAAPDLPKQRTAKPLLKRLPWWRLAPVLVTLTARELAPDAQIVASVREAENVHLVRQSGANQVIVSSETAGRLLGMATQTPRIVEMVEDLITPEAGLAIAEREVETPEVGGSPRHLSDIVLGVVRGGTLYRVDHPAVDAIEPADRLLYVRKVTPAHEE